jgi:RNA polymerase sigma-70 factor, ECF subfamily
MPTSQGRPISAKLDPYMAYFGGVELGASFKAFAQLREHFGFVPNVFASQAALPKVLEAEVALISAILFENGALTRPQKECILLVSSAAEGNAYGVALHAQMLKLFGIGEDQVDRILENFHQAGLSAATVALLEIATGERADEAHAEGFPPDESILEAILVAALGRLLRTLAVGVGAVPDFPPRPASAQRIAPSSTARAGRRYRVAAPELSGDSGAFVFLREQFGAVPQVFRAQTLKPEILEAEVNALRMLLLSSDALTRAQKQSVLFPSNSPADSVQQFASKLRAAPGKFSLEDITRLKSQGFTDLQILESVVTSAFAAFFEVLQAKLGDGSDVYSVIPEKKVHLPAEESRPTPVALSADPDADWVARVQAGDLDAFEELMNRHNKRVYRTLVGILGNPDEARDAMQDTFLKAFQHLSRFQGRSKFSTWLISIASNEALQRLRERRPTESLDDPGPDDQAFRPRQVQAWTDDPEQLYSQAELRSLLETGVKRLPAKYRVVLMLRDIEQVPIEDAATALGLGIPAVKARLLRGRLMLRESLAPHFAQAGKGSAGGGIH